MREYKIFKCRCHEGKKAFTSSVFWFGKNHSKIPNGNRATTFCRFCGREIEEILNCEKFRTAKSRARIRYSFKDKTSIKKCSRCHKKLDSRNQKGLCLNCYLRRNQQ